MLPQMGSQIAIIAVGGMIGWLFFRGGAAPAGGPGNSGPATSGGPLLLSGPLCLILFFGLLFILPWLAHVTASPSLEIFDRFYRAGSLVFGGGHVVLPLLEREVVAPGWVTHDQFLAGYGAAQAVPGPLFTLSAYLGAVMKQGPALSTTSVLGGLWGGCWALGAIFLPALLLVAGALPFWQALRHRPGIQAAMRGANTAVVGVLLSALIHPVGTAGITDVRSLALAIAAFALLQAIRMPAWAVVGGAAAVGGLLW
jgi:chromate transporter